MDETYGNLQWQQGGCLVCWQTPTVHRGLWHSWNFSSLGALSRLQTAKSPALAFSQSQHIEALESTVSLCLQRFTIILTSCLCYFSVWKGAPWREWQVKSCVSVRNRIEIGHMLGSLWTRLQVNFSVFWFQVGFLWSWQHSPVASAEWHTALLSRTPGWIPLTGLHRCGLWRGKLPQRTSWWSNTVSEPSRCVPTTGKVW